MTQCFNQFRSGMNTTRRASMTQRGNNITAAVKAAIGWRGKTPPATFSKIGYTSRCGVIL